VLLLSGCSDQGEANSGSTLPSEAAEVSSEIEEAVQVSHDEKADLPATDVATAEEGAEAFLGTWRLEDSGTRTVVIRPDGTATMHVELDFFASLIYGEEMTMDLTWSFDDGILSYTIVGGEPSENVNRVIADFGSGKSYRVVSMSDSLIHLQDVANPETVHDWMIIAGPGQG
jgi:hypothetical protein